MALNHLLLLILLSLSIAITSSSSPVTANHDSPPYLWPLPAEFTSGEETLSVDPALSLTVAGNGGGSPIVRAAFDRYTGMIFKHAYNRASSLLTRIRFLSVVEYDITSLKIIVHSDSEEVKVKQTKKDRILIWWIQFSRFGSCVKWSASIGCGWELFIDGV